MPYKQTLKTPSTTPRTKPIYKASNWIEYNKSLKKRGEMSLYLPTGDLKSQFINEECYVPGISGQQLTYRPVYTEIIHTFYRLFCWGIRQIIGYFEDLRRTKNLDISVPSFGHLSDLFSALPLKGRQFCDKLVQRMCAVCKRV